MSKINKSQKPMAAAMYIEGKSVQQVADAFGVTRQAMWSMFKNLGVVLRPQLKFGQDNHFHRNDALHLQVHKWAQHKIEIAINSGTLVNPRKCQECGSDKTFRDGRSGIQAHHCDYNKPLDVMWLCQPCHHQWHKNNTAIENIDFVPKPPQAIVSYEDMLELNQKGLTAEQIALELGCAAGTVWKKLKRGH
jgi:predicted DNA-binding protein YlxM (UPF0122 family)